MKKKYIISLIISLIIALIIILSIVSVYFLLNKSDSIRGQIEVNTEINNGSQESKYLLGTVIIKNSPEDNIIIMLDNQNVIDDSEISLNNVQPEIELGDRIKIDYIMENDNLKITNIEKYKDEENEKFKNIKNILVDETIQSYNDQIKITTNKQEIKHFILPYKLSYIEYIPMKEDEFFYIYNHIYDGISTEIPKDNLINIDVNSLVEFEVKELYNLDNKSQKKIEYIQEGSNLKFKSIGTGIYCLKIEYKNGDIIEVIFK